MTFLAQGVAPVEDRARRSLGRSSDAIYLMAADALEARGVRGGLLLDVGCGTGRLRDFVAGAFNRYVGADVIRHDGFPIDAEFVSVNLDTQDVNLADGAADVVAGIETIEHLENPRAFVRELTRLTRPGGWVLVTTPNQLSLLSKLTLVLKNQFNAFQDSCYPAHLTALLEGDLRRIAGECGLTDLAVEYTGKGRVPGTSRHFPHWLSRWRPRAFSDNVLLIGRKPRG